MAGKQEGRCCANLTKRTVFGVFALAIGVGSALLCPSSATAQTYGSIEVIALDQLNGDQTVLSQHVPGVIGETAALATDSTNGNLEAGLQITIGRHIDACTDLEAVYFGLQQWDESASVTDPGQNLQAPFSNFGVFLNGPFLDDFFNSFQQGYDYSAEFHNVELNLRRRLTCPITCVAGFRYIDYQDSLHFFSVDNPTPTSDIGRYNVDAANHMIGLQIGGDAEYELGHGLTFAGKLRTGMFVNLVEQDTFLQNSSPDILVQGGKSDVGLAGVIDASMMLTYGCGPWEVVGGYRLLMLSGVATSGGQFDFSINEDPNAVIGVVNHQDTVVLHGPFAGLRYCY